MKQLSSFSVLNVNGGTRVTYTYDVIDDETGNVISTNNKGSFYAVASALKGGISTVQNWITTNKLAE